MSVINGRQTRWCGSKAGTNLGAENGIFCAYRKHDGRAAAVSAAATSLQARPTFASLGEW
jgi:hypothetical protein